MSAPLAFALPKEAMSLLTVAHWSSWSAHGTYNSQHSSVLALKANITEERLDVPTKIAWPSPVCMG